MNSWWRCRGMQRPMSVAEARAVIERWRRDYNQVRPHSAHAGLTPEAAHLRSAGARLRNPDSSAGRPLPSRRRSRYEQPGLSFPLRGPTGSRSN
jgi:putative transposase